MTAGRRIDSHHASPVEVLHHIVLGTHGAHNVDRCARRQDVLMRERVVVAASQVLRLGRARDRRLQVLSLRFVRALRRLGPLPREV